MLSRVAVWFIVAGFVIVGVACTGAMVIAEAWVAERLWAWYVVPLGVRSVSWKHFVGIDLLVTLLTWKLFVRPDHDNTIHQLLKWVSMMVGSLLLGWLFQWWFL